MKSYNSPLFHGQTSVPTPRPRVIEASKAMLAAAKVMAIPVIVTVRHRAGTVVGILWDILWLFSEIVWERFKGFFNGDFKGMLLNVSRFSVFHTLTFRYWLWWL